MIPVQIPVHLRWYIQCKYGSYTAIQAINAQPTMVRINLRIICTVLLFSA